MTSYEVSPMRYAAVLLHINQMLVQTICRTYLCVYGLSKLSCRPYRGSRAPCGQFEQLITFIEPKNPHFTDVNIPTHLSRYPDPSHQVSPPYPEDYLTKFWIKADVAVGCRFLPTAITSRGPLHAVVSGSYRFSGVRTTR